MAFIVPIHFTIPTDPFPATGMEIHTIETIIEIETEAIMGINNDIAESPVNEVKRRIPMRPPIETEMPI